ncbi:MAG: hypothetical protein ACPG7F_00400 [Aggregatilineales bacterium]
MQSDTHYLLLNEVKALLRTQNDEDVVADTLREMAYEVSRIVESATARRFDRWIETRIFDARSVRNGGAVDGDVLIMHEDCQEILSVVVDGVTVESSALTLLPRNFKTHGAFIRRTDNGSWYDTSDSRDAITVTAVWGYGGRWRNTGLTLSAGIDDSVTTLALSGNPVLQQEHVLKVGSEYLRVLTDPADNTSVNVERGYNGSTPASHSNGAIVTVFEADARVRRVAKRYLQWLKALESNPLFGTVALGDMELPVDVTQFPKDLKKLLLDLERKGL